jgi:energy-coupling factor transporter ATP-binding protein EcfA2
VSDPIVTISQLTYRYPPRQGDAPGPNALHSVSLSVQTGEVVALVGPSGSGRSTLCLAIAGFVPQRTGGEISGSVTVAGIEARKVPLAELATTVGILFQESDANLVGLTVEDEIAFGMENLGVPSAEIERRLNHVLQQTGLTDLRDRSPWQLSGGQRQRLALAAIMALSPKVLVLDEPTGALDPPGRKDVAEYLHTLKREATTAIIIATRDPEIIMRLADRVVVLRGGAIVRVGAPREILRTAADWQAAGLIAPAAVQVTTLLTDTLGIAITTSDPEELRSEIWPLLHQSA